MLQWEFLESAPVPGGGTMDLLRRGDEMIIRVDGRELMGTRVHGSEEALAELAFEILGSQKNGRNWNILVGGLGVGFTAASALRGCGPGGRVVVAELVPAIVRWNEGPLGDASGHPLRDPRAALHAGDVFDLLRDPPEPWDAVLLDVDNGPKSLTQRGNDRLYSPQGLDISREALRPGGVLAVWSAHDDKSFTQRFRRAGFRVALHEVRARGSRGGNRHWIWTGVKE